MNTCVPSCVTDMPALGWAHGCDITTRKGGIPFFLFYKCDPDAEFAVDTGDLSPFSSLENIRQAICQLNLYVTGEGVGSKAKGTFTKKRVSSCGPEKTVAGSKQLTFRDYNADNDELIDFDFWNGVFNNRKFLQLGWVTCDDLLYMVTESWDMEPDEVIEEDSETGNSYKDIVFTVNKLDMITPIKVPGLLAMLQNLTSATCYG